MTTLNASATVTSHLVQFTPGTAVVRQATVRHPVPDLQPLVITGWPKVRISTRLVIRPGRGTVTFKGKGKVRTGRANLFSQFSHYDVGAVDPAVALSTNVTSGAAYDSSAPSNFRRVSQRVIVPTSTFVGVGVRVKSMTASRTVMLDGAQTEWSKSGATAPTAYAPARALRFSVRPNRVNYCPNPRLSVNATGYNGVTVPNRVAQGSGWAAQWDGSASATNYSPAVTSDVGQYWAASATLLGPAGRAVNVRMHDGSGYITGNSIVTCTGSLQTVTVSAYAPNVGTSVRLYYYTSAAGPSGAWVAGDMLTMTNVLMERVPGPGYLPGAYFDGDSGTDYLWKQGGTAGLTESFYYAQRVNRDLTLRNTLAQHVAFGTVPAFPEYALLPWSYTPQ